MLKEMCEWKIGTNRGKDTGNVPENKSQHIFWQGKPLCTSPILPQFMHVWHPPAAKMIKRTFYLEIISSARKPRFTLAVKTSWHGFLWGTADTDFHDVWNFPQGNYQGAAWQPPAETDPCAPSPSFAFLYARRWSLQTRAGPIFRSSVPTAEKMSQQDETRRNSKQDYDKHVQWLGPRGF